jgi:hypothetical protein
MDAARRIGYRGEVEVAAMVGQAQLQGRESREKEEEEGRGKNDISPLSSLL